jgi:hypothetical protein
MNIKVQRQKPNRREGAQGEMRLVIMARGTFLYIKGGNQWHSLALTPTESSHTRDRQRRGDLQRNIITVWNESSDHDGDLHSPGGTNSGADIPDVPL